MKIIFKILCTTLFGFSILCGMEDTEGVLSAFMEDLYETTDMPIQEEFSGKIHSSTQKQKTLKHRDI